MLTLPRETWLLDTAPGTDILAIADARDALAARLAGACDWLRLAQANGSDGPYSPAAPDIARRQLKHRALWYAWRLLDGKDPERAARMLSETLRDADNLTDRLAALEGLLALRSLDEAAKQATLAAFHERWAGDALVVDAWFSAQARNPLPGALARVQSLEAHAAFDMANPNKVRALLLAFTTNARNFHAADGRAYPWLADRVVALDELNPQVASRLAKTLADWPRFDAPRGRRMRDALEAIGQRSVSNDVREVVDKGLAAQPSQ